ncbi:MAG TPA: hypothetical protein P5164_13485 [Thermoanaerobaculia bacterium]|nr:hypothetical protein [Thermoanaerobaculia bacterium]
MSQAVPDGAGPAVEVGPFREGDGEGIAALFREVYGDGYPVKVFYDPVALARANAEGETYSIVGRGAAGEVLGVSHLYRSAPYRRLFELGAGLVRKESRNLGLVARLIGYALNEWLPGREEIEEVFGEAVCNHTHSQRVGIALGFVETALEVALMPAEAYTKERSARGRVAALLSFRCYRPRPHTVFLPSPYRDELRFLYAALDDRRDLAEAHAPLPEDAATEATMEVFDFARVARIAVPRAGADLAARLDALEAEAGRKGVEVFQVWLNAAEPQVGAAAALLRERGYFLGGVLPRWLDTDGLLMQRLLCPPDFGENQLHSDRARDILALVRRDQERASARPAAGSPA